MYRVSGAVVVLWPPDLTIEFGAGTSFCSTAAAWSSVQFWPLEPSQSTSKPHCWIRIAHFLSAHKQHYLNLRQKLWLSSVYFPNTATAGTRQLSYKPLLQHRCHLLELPNHRVVLYIYSLHVSVYIIQQKVLSIHPIFNQSHSRTPFSSKFSSLLHHF